MTDDIDDDLLVTPVEKGRALADPLPPTPFVDPTHRVSLPVHREGEITRADLWAMVIVVSLAILAAGLLRGC